MQRPRPQRRWFLPLAALALFAVGHAAPARADDAKVTYADHVRPIFAARCFSCHNPDKNSAGLDLTSFRTAIAGSSGGSVITAGDPSASRLFAVVSHAEEPKMPPNQPRIPEAELAAIEAWIKQGLLETASSRPQQNDAPSLSLALAGSPLDRPEGPPLMPLGMPLRPVVVPERSDAVTTLAAHPWSPLVAIAGEQQVTIYDTQRFDLLGVLPFEPGWAETLRFSRSGQLLLAGGGRGGQSGRVTLWNVADGQRVAELGEEYDAVLAADIDPAQRRVALGGPGKVVKIYDIAASGGGALAHRLTDHTEWITALAYSPDGILLASGDRNGGLRVWEAQTGAPFYNLDGHDAAVTDIAWRRDANVLASAGDDGQVRLWNLHNGKPLKNWAAHNGGVFSVRFAHDGRLVTTGRDNHVRLWDANGKALHAIKLEHWPLAAAFTSDGERIITGDMAGRVQVWNAAPGNAEGAFGGEPLAELAANPAPLADHLAAATAALDKSKARRAEQAAAVAAAKEAVAAAARTLNEKKTALATAAESLAAAEQALEARAAAVPEAEQALAAARTAMASAASEATKTREQREAAAAALKEQEQAVADLKAQVAKLEAALAEAPATQPAATQPAATQPATTQPAATQPAPDPREAKLVELRRQAEAAEAQRAAAAEALAAAKASEAATAEREAAARQKVTQAEAALNERSQQHAAAKQAVADATAARDAAQKDMDAQQAAHAAAEKKAEQAAAAETAAAQALVLAEARVARWRAADMRDELEAARAEVASLEEKVKPFVDADAEAKSLAENAAAALASAERRLAELPERMQRQSEALAQLQARRPEMEKALAQRREAQQTKKQLVADFTPVVEQAHTAAEASPDNGTLTDAAARAAEALALLEKDLAAAGDAVQDAEFDLEDLAFEAEAAEGAVAKLKEQQAALPDEVAKCKAEADAAAQRAEAAAAKLVEQRKPLEAAREAFAEVETTYQALLEASRWPPVDGEKTATSGSGPDRG